MPCIKSCLGFTIMVFYFYLMNIFFSFIFMVSHKEVLLNKQTIQETSQENVYEAIELLFLNENYCRLHCFAGLICLTDCEKVFAES